MLLVAGGLPTNNVAIMPEFASDPLTLSSGMSTDNSSIAESTAPVGVISSISTMTHLPPSSNIPSVLPLAPVTSATQLPFTPDSVAGVMSDTTTTWQPPPQQLSVVAGVDLSQLPPLQRQLFLRIHQRQKETTDNTTSAVTSAAGQLPAPSQPVTAVIPPPGMTSVVSFSVSCHYIILSSEVKTMVIAGCLCLASHIMGWLSCRSVFFHLEESFSVALCLLLHTNFTVECFNVIGWVAGRDSSKNNILEFTWPNLQ